MTLAGVAAIGVALLVFTHSGGVDFAAHKRFDTQLDRLALLDEALNHDVLKARFHLLNDYDDIEAHVAALQQTAGALATLPAFVPASKHVPFERQLAGFKQTFAAKENLLEEFKSENAVLDHATRSLPLASRELMAGLLRDEASRALATPLRELTEQILIYCLQSEESEVPAIRASLQQLADWTTEHPEHPQTAAVTRFAGNVSAIIRRKPQVEALTRQIFAQPTPLKAAGLLRLYDADLAGVLHRADLLRWALEAACALLLAGIGATIYALDRANRTLEGRVAARTAELSTENAQRRQAEEQHRKAERFLQSALDALSAHIAIVDAAGTILAVNEAWKKFALANGGRDAAFSLGTTYPAVAEAARGDAPGAGSEIAAGIRRVLAGEETEFQIEYTCHGPHERRWFVMRVTAFRSDDAPHLVIAHENVTARALAQRHAQNQEAELRVLFDFLPAMILFKDTKNRILRANRRVAESVGRTVAEVEGKLAAEISPWEAAKYFADDEEVIRTRAPKLGIVDHFRNAMGEEIWTETNKVPVCDRDGNVTGVVAMCVDITARRKTDQDLRWKTALLEAQTNSSLDGILVVSPQGRKILQNQQLNELLKIPRQIADDPDDGPQVRWVMSLMKDPAAFVARISHLYAHPDEIGRDEIELKDGTVLDRYSAPITGLDGNCYGRVWTFRDITERKRIEDALRESGERFAAIFAHAPIGVAMVSPGGQWLQVNPAVCELVGYSERELLAGSFQKITHPADLEINLANMRRLLAGEVRTYQMEKRYLHARGHFVPVLINVSLVRDARGEPFYFIVQMQDITARQAAAEQLALLHRQLVEASRQAGMAEVAACVLHNVGNVLNSVNISASLVSDGVRKSKIESVSRVAGLLEEHEPDLGHFITSDPRGRQLPGYLRQLSAHLSEEQSRAVAEMESLQKNIDHIKDIVARQQSYAKVSGVSEVVQIVELVEDSLQMNSGAMENHRVEIIRDYQEVPPLTVQKHKVLQILVNLLRNARHACDDRGHHDRQLTVRVAPAGPMVRISVSDNGIGILPENLTRIFSYGFTTRKEGHGFGLHGSALAAQEMGGTLRAHSDGPGTGATFTLELPVSFTRGETRTLSPETNREKTPMQRLMAAALQASDSLSLS